MKFAYADPPYLGRAEYYCGRVYRVCGACVKRDNEYWAAEAAADDDYYGDDGDD